MALLSNINDKFAVDSTGAIQFNGQAGTSGYILKSNGNAAPTWIPQSDIVGAYLPLAGGTLTGATATASGISFTVGGALTANGGINGLTLANGGINGSNYNIAGVNQLTIADPGEGIVFTGTTTLTLAVIDDTVDDKLKLTNATQLDLNSTAKITNLVNPTSAQDGATKAYVDAHPGSGGTVTSVATGNGLTGGTITTTGTLSLDRPNSQLGAVLATYGTTAGASGRIRCTAPFNTNTGKMFSIEITLYGSYTQHNYVVSAYMYSTTNQWYLPKAIYTTTGTATPDIIVGRDANGKAYISIANANYTGVLVHNMTRGYQTSLADTYDPWTIAVNAGTENSVTVATSQVWTTANHTPGNYLPLAGGIMSGNIGRSAYNSGYQVGGYNNIGASHAKTNPIHVIGTSYEPTATALSDMYGIGYTRGDTSFMGVAQGSGWGLYVASDGDARIFLDGSQGDIYATNKLCVNSYANQAGGLLFSAGQTTGTTRSLNLRTTNVTSDPSSSDGSNSTGITWGQRTDSNPYYIIKPTQLNFGGGNYSKLTLNWHTGIRIGGQKAYGGTKFYNDAPDIVGETGVIMNVGVGNDNIGVVNALTVGTTINAGGDIKTTGAAIGTTQADGDYLAKLYTASADGFLSLYTGQATPIEQVRISSYGPSYIVTGTLGGFGLGSSVTTGGFNVNWTFAGSYYNMSNTDSGNFKYTNSNGRLLTSNGTGWVTDGRDPILTLSSAGNGGATTVGYSLGLNLYSNTSTDNTYSPLICFSNLSNSGGYATTYAAIGGKKTGQGIDANWSTGELHFWTAGPAGSGSASYMQQASAMMIDDAGKVGIGTTSPQTKLDVTGSIQLSNQGRFKGWYTVGSGLGVEVGVSAGDGYLLTYNRDTNAYGNTIIEGTGIQFVTHSSGKFYFQGGNVGIGTTSPSEKLHVVTTALFGPNGSTSRSTDGVGINFTNNNTFSANADITDANRYLAITNDSTTANTYAPLSFRINPNGGSSNAMADIKLVSNGSTHHLTTTIRNPATGNFIDTISIAQDGNVGIRNTSPQTTLHTGPTTTVTNVFTARFAASNFFASGGNSMFYVPDTSANIMMFGSSQFGTNQIEFYHKNPGTSQAYVGRISTSSSATSYVTSSDYRLKENIVPISDSISRLNQLKPSRFNFIEEPGKIVDGFIAHEVQDIVPEAIVGEKDEVDEDGDIIPQGIDQAKLVPLLVAAVQELEARVKELENN